MSSFFITCPPPPNIRAMSTGGSNSGPFGRSTGAAPQNDHHLRTYYLLCALRILLVFVPQTGYIHPDEFFQSLEPMAGDEFGLEHTRTWEFNATAPLRSVAVPFLTVRVPLNLLRLAAGYIRYYLNVDPLCSYTLLVWPRLFMCALSFANDWALRRICSAYGLRSDLRLAALASSWVVLVFGSRTFSNSIEMALASVLLALVAESMHHSNMVLVHDEYLAERYEAAKSTADRVRLYKMRAALPAHSLRHVAAIAAICAVGCFNRPTFVVFGGPAVFFWLLRGLGTRSSTFVEFNVRFAMLQLCALPVVLVLIGCDSMYYGHLSMADVQNAAVGMENFVVTPLNFLRYNLNAANTAAHGMHAWWLHGVVNVPLLFNVLGVAALAAVVQQVWRFVCADFGRMPHVQSVLALMLASFVVPVLGLSCFNHQEPRFLVPLVLPVVFTYAPELEKRLTWRYPFVERVRNGGDSSNTSRQNSISPSNGPTLLTYWYTINVVLAAFFGFVHQGGIVQLAGHLSASFREQQRQLPQQQSYHAPTAAWPTHLVTSHVYNVPGTLFFLPSTQTLLTNRHTGQKYTRARALHVYEYGSELDMDQLYRRLRVLVEHNARRQQQDGTRGYRVLLALPVSLAEELALAFWRSNSTALRHRREHVFYPHLSTEALPRLLAERHPAEMGASLFGKGALAADRKCTLHAETNDVWSEMWRKGLPSDWASWMLRQFSTVAHQFGLALYRIELSESATTVTTEETRQ